MKNRTRIATGILFACTALTPGGATRLLADQSDRTHQIGSKIKCMCNGCDQAAGKCYHVGGTYSGPCDTAKTMLKEIDTHIAAGLNDQQVLDAMIKQYGPLAYVEPPKSGFGLVAWLMPIFYLLAGLALVVVVMKRWRKRPVPVASAASASDLAVHFLYPARCVRSRAASFETGSIDGTPRHHLR
jgi:cytochrome c-type biogenesis protein CcmH/NrfF